LMPSKLSPENLAPNATVDDTEKSYQRLLAFLDLASGSAFAIARCDLPSLRKEILQRVAVDAKAKGVAVKEVDISSNYSGDFVAAVKAGLDGAPGAGRLAVMVTGIDGLIYQSASQENLAGEGRTPFIARLNFNREYISHELPFPVILWLESESLALLLKQAPDFTQWISGHFHFGGPAAEAKALDQLLESYKSLRSQPATETRKQLQEFSGLLQELYETKDRDDVVSLRKRLAVLNALADRQLQLSDFPSARGYLTEALDIAKRLNDRRDEGAALANLGVIYLDTGQSGRAIEYFEKSLAVARETKNRHAEGIALTNLGNAYLRLGQTKGAIGYGEQALTIHREIGDRRGESRALRNLGSAYEVLGGMRRAVELHLKSLEIDREIGDRLGEGQALGNLGSAYCELGEVQRGVELCEQALAIHREIGDRLGEGISLCDLGSAYKSLGQTRRAVEFYEQALKIFRGIGHPHGESSTLGNLGNAYRGLGEASRAVGLHEQALAIHRRIGDRRGQCHDLGNLGVAYYDLGEIGRATEFYEQALAMHRDIGDRRGEAIDLWNLSLALSKLGDRDQAMANAEAALKILEEIEDPRAAKVRQVLAEWRKG
jgi:tetratricopeptide (TPR) repeat protein